MPAHTIALLLAAASACVPDGDTITAAGRLGVARIVPDQDPQHRAQSYLTITFEPAVCVIEPGAPAGERVTRAEFLATRPPEKSQMGALGTFTGSIARVPDSLDEPFSFLTD